jgi:hypothetical protein
MTTTFEYGICRLRDLQVPPSPTEENPDAVAAEKSTATRPLNSLLLNDRPVRTSKRFWTSLQMRFGFTTNIFRYFTHAEVFRRISGRSPDDKIRYCLETTEGECTSRLLAVSNPKTGLVDQDELNGLLDRYRAKERTYHDGIVRSFHTPRHGGPFTIAGDGFESQYVIETPIDGFGRPLVYLAMLRQICTNGAIAMTPAFRSEINLGKGTSQDITKATFGLERALEGFNNEEGFAALRQRFEGATRSWASIHEVNRLGRTINELVTLKELPLRYNPKGGDGGSVGDGYSMMGRFRQISGDLMSMYGVANVDAFTVKRQRTLPTACRVYDLINFASELATHHALSAGGRKLHGYIGDLVSGEFDLENTADQFADWRDFFLEGSEQSAAKKKKK